MYIKLHTLKDWLLNKTPELTQLSPSDAYLAKVVFMIKGQGIRKFETVLLHSIKLIHPINRKSALEKIETRVQTLRT